MIARIWRGRTVVEDADEYVEYVKNTGIAGQRTTPGNRGAMILRRDEGSEVEFVVFSLWESWDAIRRFAGDAPEVAVYFPKDAQYLLELEPLVRHYELPVGELDGWEAG